MPGGAPTTGAGAYRSFLRFLAIDPETYPLAALVGLMFGSAGFMVGRKFAAGQPEIQVEAVSRPWQDSFPGKSDKDKMSPYTYIPPGGKEHVPAPSVSQATEIRVPAGPAEAGKVTDLRSK